MGPVFIGECLYIETRLAKNCIFAQILYKMKKFLSILCVISLLAVWGCDNSKQVGLRKGKAKALETQKDSMAYAIGQDIGEAYKRQGVEINAEALVNGLISSRSEGEALLSEESKTALISAMMQEVRQKQMAQQQQTNSNSSAAVQVGKEAPDFTLDTPEGEAIALSDLRGNYVLIDFWASWCRPCRMENPNVVRVYNKYHDKGFEILGVSLDRTKTAWLQAIEKDGLTWKHVSDLKFWNSAAAQLYGVRGIPYTVLVDPKGNIIAQNLRGASLEAKLAELLGNS